MKMPITNFVILALSLSLVGVATARADSRDNDEAEVTNTSVMNNRRPQVYRPAPRVRPVRVRRVPARVYARPVYTPMPRAAIEPFYSPSMYLGIGIQSTTVLGADNSQITAGLNSGAGFELSAGWRLSHDLSLDVSAAFSFHDSDSADPGAMLGHVGLDIRYFLGDWTRALQPYIQVGIGGYFLARDNWNFDTLGGIGFQLGGGFDFYVSRSVSLGAKALYRGAYLDNSGSTWDGFATESMWLSAFTFGGDIKFHF